MKMLFKGHSTRLEMLIEKIHSNKENSYQDSEVSGSTSSEVRATSTVLETNSESPNSINLSDTEEEKDWEDNNKFKADFSSDKNKSLQFSCGYCPRQFKHKRSRDRHIKLHTGDKKYKCIQCESAFARSDHLKIHMKTHEVKKQYKCHRCNKGYNTVSAFTFHEKSHREDLNQHTEDYEDPQSIWTREVESEESGDIKTLCVFCFQWFSSVELMNDHVQSCHKKPSEKEESSSKRTKEDDSSAEHVVAKKHHYDDQTRTQEAFICSCCYEPLPNFKSFLVHMETHVSSIKNKIFPHFTDTEPINNSMLPLPNYLCCCHCNMFFESLDKLQEHLIDRHVATLYKCSLCDSSFADLTDMKVHLNTKHVNASEHFECSCLEETKLFHDRVSAELHVAKFHSNVQNDSWSESKCKYSLESLGLRIREEYLEGVATKTSSSSLLGTSSHRCGYCKEYCKTKSDLQLHMRSHQLSEKSRYKCNICDETFSSSVELASHKLIHCKIIEGNICASCKTVLMDEESFIKHQLKHNDNSKSASKLNLILPYICIVCGQTLQSDKEIELHAKFHLKFLSEQSKCHDSPYAEETIFSSNEKIDFNLELQCHLCKKSFGTKESLQIHLIEHNFFGINQYNCYVCSSVFTAASGLQAHLLGHNLAEKPYQCSRCSAGFFFRAELDNHKYIHSFKLQSLNEDQAYSCT